MTTTKLSLPKTPSGRETRGGAGPTRRTTGKNG